MKLFEMGTLPKKADLATIRFGYKGERNPPLRKGPNIILPDSPELEFFWIQEERQFLIRFLNINGGFRVCFGGTDEKPFLVDMGSSIFEIFKERGAEGFYDAIKPQDIKDFEKELGVTCKRQGDIFAVPIPYSWQEMRRFLFLFNREKLKEKEVTSSPVFGTRHKLTGTEISLGRWFSNPAVLANGVIEAPDHAPLKLKEVHFLSQTRYLDDPQKAD